MSCSICQHPKRQEIDQALINGSATLSVLSQAYGLSTSALHRHKAHLQAKVNQAKENLQNNLHQSCLFWLSQALDMIMQTAKAAQAEANGKLVLKALAQGTRLITIILKHDLPLDDRLVYDTLTSPQWAAQTSLLPDDPNLMSMSRQSLSGIFSSPCPETSAGLSSPVSLVKLDRQNLQSTLSTLDQPQNLQSKAHDHLFNQWEKGGKSPGKTQVKRGNHKEYQQDKLSNKISALSNFSLLAKELSSATPKSTLESLLEELANGNTIPADKPLSEYLHEKSLKGDQDKSAAGTDCGLKAAAAEI